MVYRFIGLNHLIDELCIITLIDTDRQNILQNRILPFSQFTYLTGLEGSTVTLNH